MRPSQKNPEEGGSDNDEDEPSDLLYGIGPGHIRILCNPPLEGGYGYDPIKVGDFTLDQIFMLLCDSAVLRMGKKRVENVPAVVAMGSMSPDEKGRYKGRSSSGKEISAEIRGKSKASRLREEYEKKIQKEHENKLKQSFQAEKRRKKNSRVYLKGDSN